MNLLHAYRHRKPHFWSQFLLGIIAILAVPVSAAGNPTQQNDNQAYQQIQQTTQTRQIQSAFYQQPQYQPEPQQAVPTTTLAPQTALFVVISSLSESLPPIRAGPFAAV
ncbi:DUF2547 family protein [Testudinibacter sp. TR-2022]|uniref:secA translation cis-regulator SecM n=1 Tax=Testudinibacter sp. TR-2022 TaxID=2585029 RepID=UPI001119C29A|nr:secA translation cis-regulator SecM [Testudinibacter sp. TR-2022]TNH04020.1 DUF2547 family protein [Pasteurellaceae bacterium Phil31]TNH08792.1 DUF2547 family protein [Testudinibacter sp. TR-2022]TNH11424.1 DUF2547 family protein [Testudinibacter sp. TR-2022]TNH11468.1 DUF2547 family protein [Testudinibacter sp. TR-2022]TNH17427.1 DUF2547 family protein [Testudinibacter sp. TR-2022]